MDAAHFLLVDDDDVFVSLLARSLVRRGFTAESHANAEKALQNAHKTAFDYAVIDLNLDGESGLALIAKLHAVQPNCRILMLTGYASIATAVEAVKRGAFQYLSKPATIEGILQALEISGHQDTLTLEKDALVTPSVDRLGWEHIQQVLSQEGGNISATARRLGMHRRTLQRKLLKHPVKY